MTEQTPAIIEEATTCGMGKAIAAFNDCHGTALTEEQGRHLITLVGQHSGAERIDPQLVDLYEEPAAFEFDEQRIDQIARSHGDGEHYAELEALAILQGLSPMVEEAPDWADTLLYHPELKRFAWGFKRDDAGNRSSHWVGGEQVGPMDALDIRPYANLNKTKKAVEVFDLFASRILQI